MPDITVIMPARNAEDTVQLAIRSTLRALPQGSRLLILDDASSDATVSKIKAVRDRRVQLLRAESNVGIANGLNILLDAVQTEIVARMDADDVCLPWRFRYGVGALERGVDITFTTVAKFGTRINQVRGFSPIPISPKAMPLHLLLANPVPHPTMVGRIGPIRDVGGYRSILAEDYDLWLRLSANGVAVSRLGMPALLYRVHERQASGGLSWHAESAKDPGLRESYANLCEILTGESPTWYSALRARVHGGTRGCDADLDRLASLLEYGSRSLNARERCFLIRKRNRLLGVTSPTAGVESVA